MASTLTSTGITFSDGTSQDTAAAVAGPSLFQFYNAGSFTVAVPAGTTRILVTGCGAGAAGTNGAQSPLKRSNNGPYSGPNTGLKNGGYSQAVDRGYLEVSEGNLSIVVGAGGNSSGTQDGSTTTISGPSIASTVTLGAGSATVNGNYGTNGNVSGPSVFTRGARPLGSMYLGSQGSPVQVAGPLGASNANGASADAKGFGGGGAVGTGNYNTNNQRCPTPIKNACFGGNGAPGYIILEMMGNTTP